MSFSGVVAETAIDVVSTLMENSLWHLNGTVDDHLVPLILAIIMPMSSYLNRRFKTNIFTVYDLLHQRHSCGFAAPTFMLLLLGRIFRRGGTGLLATTNVQHHHRTGPLKNGCHDGRGMLCYRCTCSGQPSAGGWIASFILAGE